MAVVRTKHFCVWRGRVWHRSGLTVVAGEWSWPTSSPPMITTARGGDRTRPGRIVFPTTSTTASSRRHDWAQLRRDLLAKSLRATTRMVMRRSVLAPQREPVTASWETRREFKEMQIRHLRRGCSGWDSVTVSTRPDQGAGLVVSAIAAFRPLPGRVQPRRDRPDRTGKSTKAF